MRPILATPLAALILAAALGCGAAHTPANQSRQPAADYVSPPAATAPAADATTPTGPSLSAVVSLGTTTDPVADGSAGNFTPGQPAGNPNDWTSGPYPAAQITVTNNGGQAEEVTGFTLIYFSASGQETGSGVVSVPTDAQPWIIAPGQSMYEDFALFDGVPADTVTAQTASVTP